MPKVSSYTICKKLEVVKWHKENGSVIHRTSRHFGIDRKRIREWCSKEETLLSNNYGMKKFIRKLSSGRPVLSEELDDALFEFFSTEREDGLAVTNRMLADEAQRIAKRLNFPDFKASTQYIKRWKNRFHVSMRRGTNDSQKMPKDYIDAVTAFSAAVKSFRQKNDYTPYNMANMDQTMVRFDEPSTRTNDLTGVKTVRITNTGCNKRGFTVALSARASGHKMPAFLVFKEPSGRIPPKVFSALKIPQNVRGSCSVNGWMTTEKMADWLTRIWKENEDDVRRLLILDQAPIHKTADTQTRISKVDTDLVLIPGGCTSILQPADVMWMKPFKDGLRNQWANFMRERRKTPAGNVKKPNRQDLITFVSKAWDAVEEAVIEKSFKSCGISVALDGSEDGFLNARLAEIDANHVCDEESSALFKECENVIFDSDSDESFDGFSDVES